MIGSIRGYLEEFYDEWGDKKNIARNFAGEIKKFAGDKNKKLPWNFERIKLEKLFNNS